MFSPLRNGAGKRLREPFGKAGLTVAVIALVFAMLGGAYAATNSSEGGKATASAKAKKGPRGPKGATGPAGPAGPQGPAGPAGAKGDKGDAGSAGAAGKSAEAVSFTGSKGPIGGVTCNEGGLEVKSASATTLVCNGKKGTAGSPWTAGGVLPSEQTETGTYLLFSEEGNGAVFGAAATAISFPIPLSTHLEAAQTIFVPTTAPSVPTDCENAEHSGAASIENPEAGPGFLCIFEAAFSNTEHEEMEIKNVTNAPGAGVAGAVISQEVTGSGAFSRGTWAVTAP